MSRVFLLCCLLAAGCATPIAPPGGPVDTYAPRIIATEPQAGAVSVTASSLTIRFDEYVDESSFERAFALTPEFAEPVTFRWRGRGVEVQFPEPLRANTTYVVTIGTAFQDTRSQRLKQPITLAFATGEVLDEATLTGRVLDAATGRARADLAVFAYPLPDSLPPDVRTAPPAYRTQTGEDGTFRLDFLAERPYAVVVLEDRNRNRRLDDGEPFALAPAPVLTPADSADAYTFWFAPLDTTAPALQRVRPLSRTHLEVRFTEPVRLPADASVARWTLTDSLTTAPVAVQAAYLQPEQPAVVVLETAALGEARYRLAAERGAVVDTAGTPSPAFVRGFDGSARADTLAVRFLGFAPTGPDSVVTLPPGALPALRFNRPPDTTRVRAALTVRASDAAYTLAPDGADVRVRPAADVFALVLDASGFGADSTRTQTYRRLTADDTGGLSGVVRPTDAVIQLFGETGERYTARPDATGVFTFADLPAGFYRLRFFRDTDGDARWDVGRATPYVAPEPLRWLPDSVRVRARFVNALPDTLRF